MVYFFKLFNKHDLKNIIFLEKIGQKGNYCLNEAGAGIVVETRDDFMNDCWNIVIISFDFDDGFNNFEVLGKHLRIFLDFFSQIYTACAHMLKAAVGSVILIDDKIYDVLDIKNIQAVLDFFKIEPFHQINIILQFW